jgi:hypothetical protein
VTIVRVWLAHAHSELMRVGAHAPVVSRRQAADQPISAAAADGILAAAADLLTYYSLLQRCVTSTLDLSFLCQILRS